MAILRPEFPEEQFTRLRNCWLRDRRLSFKAKGLLGYLMSHAAGYRCSQAQMTRESADGRDSVVTGIRELEGAGYLRKIPARSSGGRFAEDDYELTDPYDAAGNLRAAEPAQGTLDFGGESDRSGLSVSAEPQRVIRALEDQGEKRAPTEPPGLRVVAEQGAGEEQPAGGAASLTERAQALTKDHYDQSNGMVNYRAVYAIIRKALDRYPDDRIAAGLGFLRESHRPVTLQTLHAAIESPAAVRPGSYRPPAGPWRDRPASEYEGF